ncbi:MFS transporter [Arthrobacter livingstonensis]|uniref:MFS transporter n=1 Tax=Arthrobacter livingstonensis TaxID=670078 RepID=A0A2V5LXX0_9MICC|nr:MFS transporter [Arthrobacter livingstonensis]PYI68677.1 MFS transporter [Arthrobacter livingstonensis]
MVRNIPRSAWLIGAGIILTALTLRGAVTVVPPLISTINHDLPMGTAIIGILGMLPTAAFALFGFLTPYVIRWASLERLIVISILAGIVGQVARVFAPNTPLFLVFSVVAFGGLGAGNVLLPPLVKKYFPTKVGLMTALYVTALSLGTALPAQFSVPLADAAGWQFALSSWAAISVVALVPWLLAVISPRTTPAPGTAPIPPSAVAGPEELKVHSRPGQKGGAAAPRMNLWRSPTAWGLTLMFGCTSLNTYAMFAWLPEILTQAGLDRSHAGSMLALFAALGLPMSLLIPLLAAKMRNPFPVVLVMLACFVAGYLGLLLSPASGTWLWVSLAGLGPGTFPLSLLLINHRTRTHLGAGALSGFGQGMGYALACVGPLFFGLLRQWTGSWTAPFMFLFATLVLLGAGAYIICRPKMLEDDFAR